MRTFKKIKYKASEKKVTITWGEERSNGDSFDTTLTSPDAPRPELLELLAALTPFAVELCEFDEDDLWPNDLKAAGVTIGHGKEGARGITITCLRPVESSSAPIVLNTPHVNEDVWPAGLDSALYSLEKEAGLYIDGYRAQQSLFDPPSDSEVEPIHAEAEDEDLPLEDDEAELPLEDDEEESLAASTQEE